ncbi:uncharacterized protein [Nicotiana sylvestris]|uniref:uncharacterized protein n=1 Tax=Nicotiana sylvestris TaxID=4096 RepID=UPI00388CE322
MAPEDRSHLYDCYQRLPEVNGCTEYPAVCTAEGLKAIGKVPDIAKGEVDPNYAAWFEKMSYVNDEPEPERPTKRPHVQAFDDKIQERRRLVRENEALRAQVRQLKIEVENPGRSRKDERLIYNLTQKVRDYEDDLQKAESELATQARLAKRAEGRAAFIQQMKERYERGVIGWEKAIGNLEGKMAKQAKKFKVEREHWYALMAWLERDLQQLQEKNQVAKRTLEARTEQIGRLLQEKGIIRERVKRVANYIAMKCSSCEDMTRYMFFATVMIYIRRVMEDLYRLQGDLASRPATRPNDAPRVPRTIEALMYS